CVPDGFAGRLPSCPECRGEGCAASLAACSYADSQTARVSRMMDLKDLVCFLRGLNCEGYLLRNLDAVAFQRHNFARKVREHANSPQAEVFQDLRADSALVLDHALHAGIALHVPALVVKNSRQRGALFRARVDSKSSARVMQIDEHAAVLRGNRFQRSLHHLAAIACA